MLAEVDGAKLGDQLLVCVGFGAGDTLFYGQGDAGTVEAGSVAGAVGDLVKEGLVVRFGGMEAREWWHVDAVVGDVVEGVVQVVVTDFRDGLEAGQKIIARFDRSTGGIAELWYVEVDAVDIGDIEQVENAGHGDGLDEFVAVAQVGDLVRLQILSVGVLI